MCRDPGLIEYFLHKVDFPALTQNSFVIIFYTGKRELCLPKDLPITVLIFRQRPKLEETISGILAAIHSGEGLPEKMCKFILIAIMCTCCVLQRCLTSTLMLSLKHSQRPESSSIPTIQREDQSSIQPCC